MLTLYNDIEIFYIYLEKYPLKDLNVFRSVLKMSTAKNDNVLDFDNKNQTVSQYCQKEN